MSIVPVSASLFLALLPGTGSLSASELGSELDFFRRIPTVSSATRLENSVLDTPASVTIIDRDIIDASTATNIPDLLRLVPGFQVAHATGAQYTATYHGVSDQQERRLEVMVNGHSVYLPSHASVEWNLLGVALEDIERIEVVRTPNAPAFGGNAMFGSINIITRKPFELAGKHLRATVGSIGTGYGVARLGGRLGTMDVVGTLQYREDDGFDRIDDHKRIRNLRLHGTQDVGAFDTIDIEIGFSGGDVGADGVGSMLEPFRDLRLDDKYQSVTWRKSVPEGEGFRLAFVHREVSRNDRYQVSFSPDLSLPLGFFDEDSERFDLEFEQTLTPFDGWRFLWGAGARYDTIESDLYLADDGGMVSAWSARLLGTAEWRPIERVLVSVEALTEFHEIANTYTSPRIGATWRFADGQALRASASRNYRVFSSVEQLADYPLILSDGTYVRHLVRSTGPGLAPEKLTSYEVGYAADWADRGLSLDIRLFREEMRDIGSGARDPSRATVWSDRGGWWDTRGIETQLRFAPDRQTLLVGSYSYAETDGSSVTQIDSAGKPIAWQSLDDTTPRHTLALQLSRKFSQGWAGTLALYRVSDMRWLGEGGSVDAYTRLDAKIAKRFVVGGADAEIALIVQNLTGETYFEFRPDYVYEKPGNRFERRGFLQLSVLWP